MLCRLTQLDSDVWHTSSSGLAANVCLRTQGRLPDRPAERGVVIVTVGSGTQLPPEVENELVTELARLALEEAAPEELVLFSETAEEYFKDL